MVKALRKDIAHIISKRTLKDGADANYAKEVASVLLAERRTGELDSLLRDVQAAWAESGYVEAITTSAQQLSDEIKVEIKDQIKQLYPTAKKIIITETYDPEIIGGVRISLPNQQLDLSVEAKLNKLKQLTTAGGDQS